MLVLISSILLNVQPVPWRTALVTSLIALASHFIINPAINPSCSNLNIVEPCGILPCIWFITGVSSTGAILFSYFSFSLHRTPVIILPALPFYYFSYTLSLTYVCILRMPTQSPVPGVAFRELESCFLVESLKVDSNHTYATVFASGVWVSFASLYLLNTSLTLFDSWLTYIV